VGPEELVAQVRALLRLRQAEAQARDARAEAEEARARLQLQVERMPLAHLLLDADFRVTGWNPAAERAFGYRADEGLGRAGCGLLVPPPAREQVRAVLGGLRAGGTVARSVNENRTRDGRTIVCEWFNTPLRDGAGNFLGVMAMAQDVTERVAAEEALRRSEQRLDAVLDHLPVGVWVADRQGAIVLSN